MRSALLAFAAPLALIACDQPTPGPTVEEVAPAEAPATPSFGPQLAECAGVTAAYGNINVETWPQTDTDLELYFGTLLALMDKESGFEGASGRNAANAAKAEWTQRTREEQSARLAECRAQFAPVAETP